MQIDIRISIVKNLFKISEISFQKYFSQQSGREPSESEKHPFDPYLYSYRDEYHSAEYRSFSREARADLTARDQSRNTYEQGHDSYDER